jgi:hypothetical protein
MTGGWRKLHNEKVYNFYSLPNFIRATKLRRIGWTMHAALMPETNSCKILTGKPKEERTFEILWPDKVIIPKWISKEYFMWV